MDIRMLLLKFLSDTGGYLAYTAISFTHGV